MIVVVGLRRKKDEVDVEESWRDAKGQTDIDHEWICKRSPEIMMYPPI